MSRVGKKPVQIADGVKVDIKDRLVTVAGKKATLSQELPREVSVKIENNEVVVAPIGESRRSRAMWGMSRALIQSMMTGVTTGFSKKMELQGVGYRAQMQGKNLKLSLGFSHEVIFETPAGIEIKCPQQTEIEVLGADKQKVGFVAAQIREYRTPEPYKGKGVRYVGEYVRRKEGKKK